MNQDYLDSLKNDIHKPIVRNRIRSLRDRPESGYSFSLRRWGFRSELTLEKGERMAAKLAACFGGVKAKLNNEVPGILFNPPEIFPVNSRQCVVLITGWKPETILVS